MEQTLFYECSKCKKIFLTLEKGNLGCCESELTAVKTNSVEASVEKHIPIISFKEGKMLVQVGGVAHPMTTEHYITWIFVQTSAGGMYKLLTPQDKAQAEFNVMEIAVLGVYAYCNLHGLWKADSVFEFNEIVCSPEFTDNCI